MDFDLSKEDEILRDSIREFSEKEIKPFVKEYEEREEFPYEIVKKCAELGLMGMMIPESYGGAEMNTISYVVALEEISRIWASLGVIISVNNSLVCEPL
jgi:alkylation response protein AidB-like acyl-CoA dehydrogenase